MSPSHSIAGNLIGFCIESPPIQGCYSTAVGCCQVVAHCVFVQRHLDRPLFERTQINAPTEPVDAGQGMRPVFLDGVLVQNNTVRAMASPHIQPTTAAASHGAGTQRTRIASRIADQVIACNQELSTAVGTQCSQVNCPPMPR